MEISEHNPKSAFVRYSGRNFEKPQINGHFLNLSYSGSELSTTGSESFYTPTDVQNGRINKTKNVNTTPNRPRSQIYGHPEAHGSSVGQFPGYDKRRTRYFGSSSSSADSLAFTNMSPQFMSKEYSSNISLKDDIRKEVQLANKEFNDEVSVSASDNMSNIYSSYSSNYTPQYQLYCQQGQSAHSGPYSGYSNKSLYHPPENNHPMYQYQIQPYNYAYPQTNMQQIGGYIAKNKPKLNQLQQNGRNDDDNDDDSTVSFLSSYYARNSKETESDDKSELLSKSRRDTIKSNRYSSVPSSILSKELKSQQKRVTSVGLDFKPKEYRNYESDEGSDSNDKIAELNDLTKTVKKLSVAGPSRQISDYNRFFFEDSENEDNDTSETKLNSKIPNNGNIDPNIGNSNSNTQENELNRNNSQSSVESYDSIGSENNFAVHSETPGSKQESKKTTITTSKGDINCTYPPNIKTHRKCSSEIVSGVYAQAANYLPEGMSPQQLPPMNPIQQMQQMQPIPPYNNLPPQAMYQPYMHPSMNPNLHLGPIGYNSPYMDVNVMKTSPYENHRMSMLPNTMPHYENMPVYNKRHSLAVMHTQKSEPNLDRETSKKIENFINLRKIIASGNKSREYRLKWVKMLIYATYHQLYLYINIKGDYIQKDQIMNSQAQFVKSSMTHLLKLIKEGKSSSISDDIKAETFYLYGCIMKHDYLKYGQDFNVEKNLDVSLEYFDKCLEVKEEFYKARYKLGEIYEEVGDYENALNFYKDAAKYGYNRAIYKVAYVYQNSPAHRSLKFLKYYLNLSNIDLELVTLVGEDREDLDDIVGMAAYELGKLYEGIYSPDLLPEDEFLSQIIELIPINYSKSLSYYNKAAKLGFLLAQVKLGLVYENGDLNREVKPVKSIQWFIKAATSKISYKRHPDAMLGLSRWYLNIEPGISPQIRHSDPQKSMMWCDKAIKEFNSPEAYYFMGVLAKMGINPSNPEDWFSRAAALGYTEPQIESNVEPYVESHIGPNVESIPIESNIQAEHSFVSTNDPTNELIESEVHAEHSFVSTNGIGEKLVDPTRQ